MMKKLTKRQAIRECKRLWRLVAEGKAKDKNEALEIYPEFKTYAHTCPFCAYVSGIVGIDEATKGFRPIWCNASRFCPLVEQTGYRCFYNEEDDWLDYLYEPEAFASVIMALKE